MGIRERINDNPRTAVIVAAAVLVIACAFVALQFSGASTGAPATKAFFTIDDGKTWFVDDATRIAPFQRDGKEAVRAYVFDCNGQRFVNHVERYTPEGRRAVEAALKAGDSGQQTEVPAQLRLSGAEVKKPGAKQWASLGDLARAGPILRPTCPSGGGDAKPVEP
jgi:hypothetical protein